MIKIRELVTELSFGVLISHRTNNSEIHRYIGSMGYFLSC